jgi:soluble lytic murein transglycosylase-like protein
MPRGDISLYLNRIKLALNQGANEVLSKKRLDTKYHFLFQQMVMATAWQESCWRQFTGTESKVSCLVSYNQSSVGLMQINERVWRGIYRPESLRWNALYNIRAGCEILEEYLRRYALKKPESKTMNTDTLAQTLYAMYNGGPGQFKKFLLRSKTNKLFKSDKLFWEKYSWIKSNQLDKLRICLGR